MKLYLGLDVWLQQVADRQLVVLSDLLLTNPEQGETEKHQDEPSPQKTEDSD